jgi:hypothetical protein
MTREKHPPDTVIAAIRQHRGLLAPTAKMLGYDRPALYQYVKRHELEWVIEEAREASLDWAENALWAQIEQGNLTAIIFYLKCLGKSMGYVERVPIRLHQEAEEAVDAESDAQVIVIKSQAGSNGHQG